MDNRIFQVECFEAGCDNYSSWPMEKMGPDAFEGCLEQIRGLRADGWIFEEGALREGIAETCLIGQCPTCAAKAGD